MKKKKTQLFITGNQNSFFFADVIEDIACLLPFLIYLGEGMKSSILGKPTCTFTGNVLKNFYKSLISGHIR